MGVKPFFFYFYNHFSFKLYTSPCYYVGGRTEAKGHWSAAVRQSTIRISLNSTSQKGRRPGCNVSKSEFFFEGFPEEEVYREYGISIQFNIMRYYRNYIIHYYTLSQSQRNHLSELFIV